MARRRILSIVCVSVAVVSAALGASPLPGPGAADSAPAKQAATSGARKVNKRIPAKKPKRQDQPDEAQRRFVERRSPDGVSPLDPNLYVDAMRRRDAMPQIRSSEGRVLPSRGQIASSTSPSATDLLDPWTALGPGNIGGRTRCLVIHPTVPTTMWAGGVAGGVWKTTNGGATWAPKSDLAPNIAVNSMAIQPGSPNVLYAGTGEGVFNADGVRGNGILKSTDGGETWAQLAATANSTFHYVNKIVVSTLDPNRVYAATRLGVQRSTNAGSNWTQVLAATGGIGAHDLVIRTDQATDVVFASVDQGASTTIYRNLDAGGMGTFTPSYTDARLNRTTLGLSPSNQAVLYALAADRAAGTFNQGLYAVLRTTDGGGAWAARVVNDGDTNKLSNMLLTNPLYQICFDFPGLNQGWYDNVIAVDPVNPDRVFAGGVDLFRSDDGGQTWGLMSAWSAGVSASNYVHADQHGIFFPPGYDGAANQTMYVTNDGGVFRTNSAVSGTPSTDVSAGGPLCTETAGSTFNWTNLINNYGVTQFYHGVVYPNGTQYFGGTQDNGTLRGADGGPNAWTRLFGGDGGYVAVAPDNTNVLFCETTNLSILKSTNGGSIWADAVTGITEPAGNFRFTNPFLMDPSNPQILWTAGRFPWRTSNQATSWTQAGAAWTSSSTSAGSAIAVAKTDSAYVLVGRGSGHVNRTTNGLLSNAGTVWSEAQPTAGYCSWLEFDPNDKTVAYATYSTFGVPHVWKSTNSGATWTSIAGTLPDIPVHSIQISPTNPQQLFIGTDLGVFTSTNGGGNWLVENSGFANTVVETLVLRNGTLWAFTHGRGVYKTAVTGGANPAPTVSSVNPSCASTTGGRTITITGTGFLAGATVTLLGTACNVTNVTATTITCTTGARANAPSTIGNVVVTNTDLQAGTLTNGFNYALRGDTNNNSALTAADTFYLKFAIFLGGSPVVSLCQGDTNSNNAQTAADSFFLNLYVFLGGAAPGP